MSQPYGQQPAGDFNEGQSGYGAMPPAPPEHSSGPVTRPGGVTAAAVLAFVQAGITLICTIFALVIFGAVSSQVGETEAKFGVKVDKGLLALGWIVAIAGLVGAGLLIWAGIKTLSGTAGKLMVIAAGLQIVLCIVWLAALGGGIIAILLVVMPIISLALVLTGPAKQFEASRRA
ncbi:hypothetical protein [Actinophytocola sp.]|uniref:hypothetical protein n=1 Tax=Actinophytocola sp. TaxID=1872138 RepID=UPI00389A8E44